MLAQVRFNEEEKCYEIFRDLLKQQFMGDTDNLNISTASADTEEVCRRVTCENTLATIQQAQNQANRL